LAASQAFAVNNMGPRAYSGIPIFSGRVAGPVRQTSSSTPGPPAIDSTGSRPPGLQTPAGDATLPHRNSPNPKVPPTPPFRLNAGGGVIPHLPRTIHHHRPPVVHRKPRGTQLTFRRGRVSRQKYLREQRAHQPGAVSGQRRHRRGLLPNSFAPRGPAFNKARWSNLLPRRGYFGTPTFGTYAHPPVDFQYGFANCQ